MANQFGDKLRYLRRHHHLTQGDLAHLLVLVSQSHISYLESHRKAPSLELVLRIADVFGVTTDYLLRDHMPVETISLPTAMPTKAGDEPPQVQQLGVKLHALRRQRGWTQWDVAQRLPSTTQAHISFVESGRKVPSLELVLQFADLFGVSTEYLLRDSMPVAGDDDSQSSANGQAKQG